MDWIEAILAAHPAATDIHITDGAPVLVREAGALVRTGETGDFSRLEERLSPEKRALFHRTGACDSAFSAGGARCRLHCYRTGGRAAAALRVLPALDALPPDGDEAWRRMAASFTSGLVLVTGPTGSGKSTALARLILAAAERPRHIVTIEDPPEFLFPSGTALIHQREVGADTASFAAGVREALREDPDVIVIGELRDAETMAAALTVAETGRLVLATMHNRTAADAVGRLVHAFPAEKERDIRALLASVLRTAAAQALCRTGGRAFLLREILTNIPAVAHLIREGKDEQIASYMEMGRHGMRTMKQAAEALLRREALSAEDRARIREAAGL